MRFHVRRTQRLIALVVGIGATRGHAYNSARADGGGPCTECGYGSGAPQHQATYGVRARLVAPSLPLVAA